MSERKDIYRTCIRDIEAVEAFFDLQMPYCRGRQAVQGARDAMAGLKSRWAALRKQYKNDEVEHALHQAICEIHVKSNSIPDARWWSELYAAKFTLEWWISHGKDD